MTISLIESDISVKNEAAAPPALKVALLTGGFDRPYAFGLAMSLVSTNVLLDVIGSESVDSPEMHSTPNLHFINLWPAKRAKSSILRSAWAMIQHYLLMFRYATGSSCSVFHILWNSKIQWFDRTVMMLLYKAMGRKVALTAHNVNQGRRDGKDSLINRLTLKVQYKLTDRIFVHTQKMKDELVAEFGVAPESVVVIRHPINNAFPSTDLTPLEAKRRIGIGPAEKAILCLGRIKPYKGVEHLLSAFQLLIQKDPTYRLIIAGEVQKGNEEYLATIRQIAAAELQAEKVLLHARFIADDEMEVYLKAADVLVLPYNEIFQSGVLFLGYSFGLPVIATDVGSFREEIVDGETGYVCRPGDAADLARTIETYFASDLYLDSNSTRRTIVDYAARVHSWEAVAKITCSAYEAILENHSR
ncbi:MAG TPA: glycosyltransferase family 4 protein [Terracidiphilus sp.]|jgi:glycosyltransferase involved in cell wall biosynthesis